jgi:hypothetical protein
VEVTVPISFNIPLKATIGESKTHFVTQAEWESKSPAPPVECLGTSEKPTAEPGSLCIYEGLGLFSLVHTVSIFNPGNAVGFGGLGAGTTGSDIAFHVSGAGEEAHSRGTWAVTAP